MRRSCDRRPYLHSGPTLLRSLQFLGGLIDHFPGNQIILNFGIAVRETPTLFLLSFRRHRDLSGFVDQHSKFVCHVIGASDNPTIGSRAYLI